MNIVLSIPAVCMIIGIACGIMNNAFRAHDFWFWCSGLTALGILLSR